MALIHISKDPPDKTPLAFTHTSLTRYIVLGRCVLKSKYIGSGREIGIMSPEFRNNRLTCYAIKKNISPLILILTNKLTYTILALTSLN